jgi:hypothetical protein
MAILRQQCRVGQLVKCPLMRRILAAALFVIALVSTWLVYSKVTQDRREVAYRAAIAPFQHDLRLGMSRNDVREYLDARSVEYHKVRSGGSEADTYEIEIGEEPASAVSSLFCEPWTVYVALEFSAAETLREIHIKKVGTCL